MLESKFKNKVLIRENSRKKNITRENKDKTQEVCRKAEIINNENKPQINFAYPQLNLFLNDYELKTLKISDSFITLNTIMSGIIYQRKNNFIENSIPGIKKPVIEEKINEEMSQLKLIDDILKKAQMTLNKVKDIPQSKVGFQLKNIQKGVNQMPEIITEKTNNKEEIQ